MKTIKKNVYYCEFCKKRGLSKPAMEKHEKHCTANPNRACRVCDSRAGSKRDLITYFKTRFTITEYEHDKFDDGDQCFVTWLGEPITMKELRSSVDNCPNCLFSLIRQLKLNHHYFHDAFTFDYKKELISRLNEKNERTYGESPF